MISRQIRLLGILLATALASQGLVGCSSSSGGGPSTGGTTSAGTGGGSGGTTSTGGSTSSGGTSATGGSVSSGGSKGSGGVQESGGTVGSGGSGSGGTTATGGSSSGGATTGTKATGGAGSGGAMTGGTLATGTGGDRATGGMVTGRGGATTGGSGGRTGNGGASAAGGGSGNGGSTGTSTGACQKGQIKANEVVIMGESFYAIAPQYIQNRLQDDARKAGSLGASETYRNVAVSGQNMNYIATTEWTNATQGGASVKNVIMDGGGIDCLTGGGSAGCTTCPDTFKTLLGKMATAGVQDVIYTRYPEPGSPPGSNASLKACLDATMPKMETVCSGASGLRCHWVDLRPVWQTGDVLSDGLHPTQSGGNHVGDLVWSEMVKDCMAQ